MEMPVATVSAAKVLRRRGSILSLGKPAPVIVRECVLELDHLADELDGLRIVQVSDLHFTEHWHEAYDRSIEIIGSLSADLILCTGDIVHSRRSHRPAMPQVERFFGSLRSRLGTYSILGNHDHAPMADELGDLGVTVINGREILRSGASELELIGAPGLKREHLTSHFIHQMPPRSRGIPRIVMAHYPDHFERLSYLDPDIYLCGHTHGGQVCLPGGFPIIRHDSSPRGFCRGYHKRGRSHYIVNHGFGYSGFNIRVFCPAEVVLISLRKS